MFMIIWEWHLIFLSLEKWNLRWSVKDMLRALPDDMDGTATTPAAGYLFEVNHNNPEWLDRETADMFHHNDAKLLFLCKRARPDIQTAVSFLCTRVKSPDVDEYKKLRRVMQYLRHTIDLSLTLEADNTKVIGGLMLHLVYIPSCEFTLVAF
jgi:hypothetical protein